MFLLKVNFFFEGLVLQVIAPGYFGIVYVSFSSKELVGITLASLVVLND